MSFGKTSLRLIALVSCSHKRAYHRCHILCFYESNILISERSKTLLKLSGTRKRKVLWAFCTCLSELYWQSTANCYLPKAIHLVVSWRDQVNHLLKLWIASFMDWNTQIFVYCLYVYVLFCFPLVYTHVLVLHYCLIVSISFDCFCCILLLWLKQNTTYWCFPLNPQNTHTTTIYPEFLHSTFSLGSWNLCLNTRAPFIHTLPNDALLHATSQVVYHWCCTYFRPSRLFNLSTI